MSFLSLMFLGACELDADPDGDSPSPLENGDSPELVSGFVCAPSGAALALAYVFIPVDNDGDGVEDSRYETTSDVDGSFDFADLPAGHYTVHIVKGRYELTEEFDYTGADRLNVGSVCIDPGDLKLAVVKGDWDNIEEIIDYLGFPYDLYEPAEAQGLLADPARLAPYDALFLNCGSVWDTLDGAATVGLEGYVLSGGKAYASDWAYVMVERAFPNMVQFYGEGGGGPKVGSTGALPATVSDPDLQRVLGSDVELYYQLPAWVVAQSVGTGTSALVEGDPFVTDGAIEGAPLAMKAPEGKGSVLYTTFHNESQATADAKQILYEFVLNL